ncbi:FMN-binding negative transcriptional regulator [Kytococcus schroeteri]|uniref:FMN-binding negative transcriptional regulator n=1 Tax=Kytococcus schroeteri TaxID=138300 RepID=UPI0011418C15|nr:FMN-binding negative transcriptional regulator [Kytococcus schroeteri]
MLVFPQDAARDEAEWREWLDGPELFGVLAVNNADPAGAPVVVPTHATLLTGIEGEDGPRDELVLHLARVNPVFEHLEEHGEVRFVVTGAVAYVPGPWRAAPDVPSEHGVPTSYYASVQFRCGVQVVDDPAGKAEVLTHQFADLQPEGGSAPVTAEGGPYARMLPAITALRLPVREVVAKFKYDDEKPAEHRQRVSAHLEERGRPGDRAAARQQRRRLEGEA